MDKDYAELLSALKKEEKTLKKEIQNALKTESDFYTAHHLQRGLYLLQSRIRSLQKITDPLFEKKEIARTSLKWLKKLEHRYRDNSHLASRQQARRAALENELSQLEAQKRLYTLDTQIIDEALFSLADEKIEAFKIWLNKELNFFITINRAEPNFELTLLPKEITTDSHLFSEQVFNHLAGLGFVFFEDDETLVYKYPVRRFKDANEIKILLARLFFEVFPYNIGNMVFLEYTD